MKFQSINILQYNQCCLVYNIGFKCTTFTSCLAHWLQSSESDRILEFDIIKFVYCCLKVQKNWKFIVTHCLVCVLIVSLLLSLKISIGISNVTLNLNSKRCLYQFNISVMNLNRLPYVYIRVRGLCVWQVWQSDIKQAKCLTWACNCLLSFLSQTVSWLPQFTYQVSFISLHQRAPTPL